MMPRSLLSLALAATFVAAAPSSAFADPPGQQEREREQRDREREQRDREREQRDRERAERDREREQRRAERDRERERRRAEREYERKYKSKHKNKDKHKHEHQHVHHDDGSVVIIEDGDGDGDGIQVIIETEPLGPVLDLEGPRLPAPPQPPQPPGAVGRRGPTVWGPPGRSAGWQDLKNDLSTSRRVKGPVSFELGVVEGNIEIVRGAPNVIRVDAKGASARTLVVEGRGSRYEANFDGHDVLRRGNVRVQLPPGSSVEIEAVSGNVLVAGLGGNVEVEAVSGNVKIQDANRVDVEAVSGDVRIDGVRGAVSLETVSGDGRVVTVGKAPPRLEFATTSGDMNWYGTCGRGCRIEVESLSGEVGLHLGSGSGFELEFESFSGDLRDDVGIEIVGKAKNRFGPGRAYRAVLGRGEGRIEAETHSGDLSLKKK